MNLIDSNDILKASKLNRFGGNLGGSLVAKLVMYIMRLNKINKLYSDVYSDNPEAFLDRLIEALGVTIEVNEEDLQKIPKEGAFITISKQRMIFCLIISRISRALIRIFWICRKMQRMQKERSSRYI